MRRRQLSGPPLLIAAIAVLAAACGEDEGGTGVTSPMGNTTGTAPPESPTAGTGAAGSGTAQTGSAGRRAPTTGAAGGAPTTGAAGAATAGAGAATAGTGGTDTTTAGTGAAGMDVPDAGAADAGPGMAGVGTCCPDGNCICRGEAPTELTVAPGPYQTESYDLSGVGCVYYPTDGEPPYSAVAISDGFVGTGGCGPTQTNNWGPLYASYGIVAMIVETGSSDRPDVRGLALADGVAGFKSENENSDSPLFEKLAGRYGTSGFSMGGGGTTYASQEDPTLLSSVAIMPWGPVNMGIMVPTLIICGSSDGTAACGSHGTPAYAGIPDSVPKMRVEVSSGHSGQPGAGGDDSGKYGLAFTKTFLDGDTRWRPLLVSAMSEESNIE